MKKYLYGQPAPSNQAKYNVIELTEGFSVDVRYDSYELVITIANATGTLHISHELDISRATDTAEIEDIKHFMLTHVMEELEQIICDADSATFTDIYDLWEGWEDTLADKFYTERCREIHYKDKER